MKCGLLSALTLACTAVNAADAPPASLADAIQRQDLKTAYALLDQHIDVNATLADGSTALFWAARWDESELVDRLLGAGADPKKANRYGISPLLEACENGDAAVIGKLLSAGADPNSAQPEGETALMTAARTGDTESVGTLIDHGARVNLRETWRGQTAMMWAVAEKHPDVVRLLIERGAEVDARSKVFDYSQMKVKEGSVPMNYPRGGFTALLFAARDGDLESGRALIDAHANVNLADPDGATPLVEAIVNFHFDFAAFLLEHGADVNTRDIRGRSPLYAAVDMHSLDTSTRPSVAPPDKMDAAGLIKALLDHGANPNLPLTAPIPPRSPLDDVDGVMGAGATPFLRAAKSDDVEVMRLLLAKGADPKAATRARVTALMAAAGVGWRDGKSHGSEADAIAAVRLCLDLGLDINAASDQRKTALHGAAQRGAEDLIFYLVSHGADLGARDETGGTPLGSGVVQTFSVDSPAFGTSTGGFQPSMPATFACQSCTGAVTASSSASWVQITSVDGTAVSFNVLSNTSTSPRAAMIQAKNGRNRTFLTIHQAGSRAPLRDREIAFLYQRLLGREAEAEAAHSGEGVEEIAAALLERKEVRETVLKLTALYKAAGATPEYSTYAAAAIYLLLERAPSEPEMKTASVAGILNSPEFLEKLQ